MEKFGGIGGNFIDLAILLECMGEVFGRVLEHSLAVMDAIASAGVYDAGEYLGQAFFLSALWVSHLR